MSQEGDETNEDNNVLLVRKEQTNGHVTDIFNEKAQHFESPKAW